MGSLLPVIYSNRCLIKSVKVYLFVEDLNRLVIGKRLCVFCRDEIILQPGWSIRSLMKF